MKFLTLLILLSLAPFAAYAGGGCNSLKILEVLSETKDSISVKVEHPGYAGPVAVSERKAVKGKKKNHSIISIKYGMRAKTAFYNVYNIYKDKKRYLKAFNTCQKSFKEKIKAKEPQLFCFMGGTFVKGYERVFKVANLHLGSIDASILYVKDAAYSPEKKYVQACSLITSPNY